MKTAKIELESIKSADGWMSLIYKLKYDQFKSNNSELNEDEAREKFYNEVVLQNFTHGEYASLEIEFNEKLEIIGGRLI